ncbi:TPA: DUF898 family protein [Enterobacter cancerogenus]|nr:DUF898 family protein [Enterobacter cancerogenus]HDR2163499.1 DUF898 family protein [Enterobacter cancerogenus]HDR2266636.1 DUF898 family protein [Enterobacter cancerogenus]
MKSSESAQSMPQTSFSFHGKAGKYFIICLVNVLLVFITLGIYLPWAMVKCRRYIYSNMELNGARFSYRATGGAFFKSWLLIMILYIVVTVACGIISPSLTGLSAIIFIALMPLMVVKSLRYQADVSSLNNVRFGFSCSLGKAYWTMLILPLLLVLGSAIIITLMIYLMGDDSELTGLIVRLAVMILLSLVIVGLVIGVLYWQIMNLTGNSARFGIHRFNINVPLKCCIKTGILSMLILVPFVIVIAKLLSPLAIDVSMESMSGRLDEQVKEALFIKYSLQIFVSYLLYIAALVLMGSFAVASIRNLFFNGLYLEKALTFRSTVTFTGLLMQVLVMVLAIGCTCWLAYPWAKIRLVRYLASNTHVIGYLDNVEFRDTDEPNDSGFLAAVSRGIMPVVPLI